MDPKTILAIIVVACSVVSAQQPTTVAPINGLPSLVSCNLTTAKPNPTQQSYVFQTCIVAKFAAYYSIAGQYVELKNGVVNTNSSSCVPEPKLVIDFSCSQLEFEFTQNNTQIAVKSINGMYMLDNSSTTFSNSTQMFKTSEQNHYYKCNAEQAVLLKLDPTGNGTIQLMISNVAFEAFRSTTGTDFYKVPEECELDSSQVSDLVRIGVGICLVLLVVLVLVAYFVGRRRWAERSSYESV